MRLNELQSTHRRKKGQRLGRGRSSGRGKTAGRGTKGQKSRSGYNIPRRFEGGQTSLIQKLPKKRGFKSFKHKPQVVKFSRLIKHFAPNETITPKSLFTKGLIDTEKSKVKILGPVDKKTFFKIKNCLLSKSVEKQIKA